jgi:hypothetical protein
MKFSLRIILVLGIAMIGCAPKDSKTLQSMIPGEWRNVYIKVILNNGGPDEKQLVESDSAHWEERVHIKPIRTFFASNGTYRSDYYTIRDSLFRTVTGKWRFSNDTLLMDQLTPAMSSYKLKANLTDGLGVFEGMLDFDQDGNKDDYYLGKQRKQ